MMANSVPIIVAIIGVVTAVVAAYVTALLTARQQQTQLREQLKLEYSIETVLRKLLENPDYAARSFKKLKYHIRGFSDDNELRMALLRAGAVVLRERDGDEYWGLLSRNEESIK